MSGILPVFDVAELHSDEELAYRTWGDGIGGWHSEFLSFKQIGNAKVYWTVCQFYDGFENARICTIVCATRPGRDPDGNTAPSVQSIASNDNVPENIRKEIGRHLMIAL